MIFQSDGVLLTLTAQEPTTNEDGSPLRDLASVKWQFESWGDVVVSPSVAAVPASSPTGGQHVQTTVKIPCVAGQRCTVQTQPYAVNATGEESEFGNALTYTINRRGKGKPPKNVQIG